MPQFQLEGAHSPDFRALDDFTQGYIEAAFFTEEEQLRETYTEQGIEPLGTGSEYNPGFTDLAPETLAEMIADCARFQKENGVTLYVAKCARGTGEYSKEAQAGHDFWLTRNGHGAGFWDGDWSEYEGEALTQACKAFGETNLYVGDDGRIYAA